MNKILIIENDRTLSKIISEYLKNKSFECDISPTIEKAFKLLENKAYDLLILDRALDDGDGIEVLEFINDFDFKTRVIILSKKSEVFQRINGLEKGADDYLAKPFSISELYLRIKNLLSKEKTREIKSFSLGPITIFPKTGEIILNKITSTMRKKEIQILACLFRYKNHVVSREMIINDVWSGNSEIPTYTTLDVYIRRIRMFLGNERHIIKTVRGFGYMASVAE